MADTVKSLDITLRTRAELQGARDFERALQRQIGQAKALGKDYSDLETKLKQVQASIQNYGGELDQVTKATSDARAAADDLNKSYKHYSDQEVNKVLDANKKQLGSISQLKGGLRGLALQMPILGRLSEVIFSKMGLAFAGFSAAIKIWTDRTREAQRTFSETELPDFIASGPGQRGDAALEYWDAYKQKILDIREELHGLAADHQAAMQGISRDFELLEQLKGEELSPEEKKDQQWKKAAEQNRQAANFKIRAEARKREADALTGQLNTTLAAADPQRKKELIEANQGALSTAESEVKDRTERLGFIDDAANSTWLNQFTRYKFYVRYGWKGNIADARKLENEKLSAARTRAEAAQNRIDLLEQGGATAAGLRERIAKLTQGSAEDQAQYERLTAAAKDTVGTANENYAVSRFKRSRPIISSEFGGGITVTPDTVARLRQVLEMGQQTDRHYEGQEAHLRRNLNDNGPDIEQNQRDLEEEDRRNQERIKAIEEVHKQTSQLLDDLTSAVVAGLQAQNERLTAAIARIQDSYNV